MSLRFKNLRKQSLLTACAGLALVAMAGMAGAQPFGSWGIYSGDFAVDGYIEIPHSPALNPISEITIEGWVNVQSTGGCDSLIGKDFEDAWWVGICNTSLRSYLRGTGSSRTGGAIGEPGWHHFAVTFDGNKRCHYIDGKLPQCWNETGNLTASSADVRIGSDESWDLSPDGAINEIRLWNVARTTSQIRSTINVPITAPQAGLVAAWANGGPTDVVGPHDGSVVGTVPQLTFPVAIGCTSTATSLCVLNRFVINVDFESTLSSGPAQRTNPSSFRSGLFWFFDPTNWEVMVKVLDGCAINNRYWVYSAATTDQFFRMAVLDQEAGRRKVYFNYAGNPAPAITDNKAFTTCP